MNTQHIIEKLRQQLDGYQSGITVEKVGTVLAVGDGVAHISGLSDVMASEMIDFGNDVYGVALNLEEDSVGAIILGDQTQVKEGMTVKSTGKILEIAVGDEMIGRVINPLGVALDGLGEIKTKQTYPIEKIAPGVITREPVTVPLQTGVKVIDAMIPIGRGQRELIIGDRQTGKTALVIDTIINQKDQGVICIYVAIGQKESKVARIVARLKESGALKYTIVVIAGASDPASMQYLAPFAGCAVGEYFMDQGKDVLVVYDDLSKQAAAYREVSLLLKRPPSREAYPGDVFYLHSRLLERAARLNEQYGGGSLTALPIIETQAGDISAYIPTNVISITDGQIFLETDLFYQGVRPAVNAGLSVSRVGSAAQIKAMKQVAGKLKLGMAQYRELAAFAQFGSDLDEATKNQIDLGKRMTEVLKQGQYEPLPVAQQVVIFYAAINGLLNAVPVERVAQFEKELLSHCVLSHTDVLTAIAEKKQITEEIEVQLKEIIAQFKETLDYLEV